MRDAYDVIYSPVVSEKSAQAIDEDNVYTFIVNKNANKIEIAQAIEKLWDVKVDHVRTMRYAGKAKRALLAQTLPQETLETMRAIKRALDPEGLLGCGNVLEPRP